jgi:hypothetical protein
MDEAARRDLEQAIAILQRVRLDDPKLAIGLLGMAQRLTEILDADEREAQRPH